MYGGHDVFVLQQQDSLRWEMCCGFDGWREEEYLGRDTISPGQTVQWSFAESDNKGTSNKTAEPVHSYHTQKQQTVLKEAVETIGITFNDDIREREGERGRERELVYMCVIQFLL